MLKFIWVKANPLELDGKEEYANSLIHINSNPNHIILLNSITNRLILGLREFANHGVKITHGQVIRLNGNQGRSLFSMRIVMMRQMLMHLVLRMMR